jgi:hypothetical protein
MERQAAIGFALLALGLGGSCLAAEGQKTVVIHAGQLFDGKSDRLLSNQVIIIQGDRIADVGPAGSVRIPAGAEEIDLGSGTIMPGLIDSHNHQFKIGDHPGAGPDAAVPAVIQPGSVFSAGYVTLFAAKNAKLDLEGALPRRATCRAGGRWTWTFARPSTKAWSQARGWS